MTEKVVNIKEAKQTIIQGIRDVERLIKATIKDFYIW